MYFKVSRDPVYTEVYLYPIEILLADTKAVQRLKFLSQLAGAENVYPSATHTRISHSMGTMHVAGLYAKHLFPGDNVKFRILRLAGLLHDIGHGPYSHQFDDIVYSRAGYKHGHDTYRNKILMEYLPDVLLSKYENLKETRLKEAVDEDLANTVGSLPPVEAFRKLMEMINEVFEGEDTGSLDFNIVQGPLGADRMDFVLRDSYFAGTRHFGTGALERIIRGSCIVDNEKRLAYNLKIIDDIYTTLFSRFMMYKNVYFHKTARAADLMIQEILSHAYYALKLDKRIKDVHDFMKLTDNRIVDEVNIRFEDLVQKKAGELEQNIDEISLKLLNGELDSELSEEERELVKAHEAVERYRSRDLWKLILEISFSTTGVDPSIVSNSVAADSITKIKSSLEKLVAEDIDEIDRELMKSVLNRFDELFRIDTPYKLSLAHPQEFLSSSVFLFDEKRNDILNFEEFERRYPAYKLMTSNLIQIVRIYCTSDIRWLLKKYEIIPEEGKIDITTRW